MPRSPHKLALYRAAVQHPPAEAAFLQRVYRHHRKRDALLLKEDFAGTAAVAMLWVMTSDEHQAVAVDSHEGTVRWAQREADRWLGERAADLHLIHADVMQVAAPRVDVVAALNFSAFIHHDRASLLAYLRHARRSLRPGGILVLDVYGGPGAMRVQTQHRAACTEDDLRFEYHWEQRRIDALTGRVENHIHFTLPDGRTLRSAFRYDWRLWSPAELTELIHEAGFEGSHVWCDTYDPQTAQSDGRYRPVRQMPSREDWIAYVVALK